MPTDRPARDEAADYYFKYIDQVGAGDIRRTLETQGREATALLRGIGDERSLHRYEPDKWSIRDVVAHLNDTERLFVFRALWFARGFDSELPSFDPDISAREARGDDRSWSSLVDEFERLRASTVSFFDSLPADAWSRRGVASGNPFTVRALAWIGAGHVAHHVTHLRTAYL
jgi:hypothetical protein